VVAGDAKVAATSGPACRVVTDLVIDEATARALMAAR
jgi:DNA-binding transcriptional regulator LsrR (DeoR family)